MIAVVSFNRDGLRQDMIEQSCRMEVARRSEEPMEYTRLMDPDELASFGERNQLADLLYCEVESGEDVAYLKTVRSRNPLALLVLFTAPRVSPLLYLKPGIAPSALLLQPFSRQDLDRLNSELMEALFAQTDTHDAPRQFVLKERDGRTMIPYEKISWFEARNKRIYLRIGNREYEFYDSIENIADQSPDYFLRCHRAYLVNTRKISKVLFGEGRIELSSGEALPLSRTYRQRIKEWLG